MAYGAVVYKLYLGRTIEGGVDKLVGLIGELMGGGDGCREKS